MDEALLTLAGAALLAGGAGMVILERRAVAAGREFPRGHRTQELYWMTYLSSFVLAACLFLKTLTG